MIDVSVIIVSYNTKELTLAAIRSVLTNSPKLAVEVIVVDNNSQDDTAAIVKKEFPEVTLLSNQENVGFAKAVNQGYEVSSGQFVLLLNSDAELERGGLSKMVDYMNEHPNVGVLGPRLEKSDGRLQYSAESFPSLKYLIYEATLLRKIFPGSREFGGHQLTYRNLSKTQSVDKVTGAVFLVRRAVIEQIGFMDERYFMYYEETDFLLRMRRRTHFVTVYFPEVGAIHHFAQSGGGVSTKVVGYSLTSMNKFYAKNFGLIYNIFANLVTFGGALVNLGAILLVMLFARDLTQSRTWYTQVLLWYLQLKWL